MADKKLGPEEQEKAAAMGTAVEPESESGDIREIRELFEGLEKKKLPELMEGFERGFYRSGVAALELFQELCLKGSNSKKKVEAAKYFLGFFKDPNVVKNLALLRELRGRMGKDAAKTDDKATWKNEPKPKE